MVSGVELPGDVAIQATIAEAEGITSVISVHDATRLNIAPGFVMAWLTVDVNSALDAVGFSAAITAALARHGLACNVLAGYHHDHLLVGFDDQARAIDVLRALAGNPGSNRGDGAR
jgi:hypothetical protein